ncbi:MAG: DUF2752 domain-containing protein [Planctomycetota bacterium]|jgi:hypothetical protein
MQTSQHLNKSKFFFRSSPHQRVKAAVVFLAVVAFFGLFRLTAHYKIALWPLGCGFEQKYDLPCPGCGMNTSVSAFAQGKILEAFYIQPACALLCSVLAFSALLAFIIAVFGVYFDFIKRFFAEVKIRYIILALIIVFAAGWAVTLARAFSRG